MGTPSDDDDAWATLATEVDHTGEVLPVPRASPPDDLRECLRRVRPGAAAESAAAVWLDPVGTRPTRTAPDGLRR